MGVSRTMPISTGLQLVATTLFGVIVFHECIHDNIGRPWDFSARLYYYRCYFNIASKWRRKNAEQAANFKRGIVILLISTVGYLVYVVVIRLFNVDGWSALLPQAVGMVLGGILLTFKHQPFNKYAIRNIIPGLIWAAGNMFLFISQPRVGVTNKFLAIANGNYYFHAWWDSYIRWKENETPINGYRCRYRFYYCSRNYVRYSQKLKEV